MKEPEIWKTVDGHDNFMVSTFGRVKRLETTIFIKSPRSRPFKMKIKERITGSHRLNSYALVYLSGKMARVHRLVAKAFIPNPENKPEVNHKDGVKFNNSIDNLEWCTISENAIHAYRTGLRTGQKGQESHRAKLTNDDIIEIRQLYSMYGLHYPTAAREYGINRMTIGKIVGNKRWKHLL